MRAWRSARRPLGGARGIVHRSPGCASSTVPGHLSVRWAVDDPGAGRFDVRRRWYYHRCMAREFDRVVQLRLSARQHRFLKLAAARAEGDQNYAPVVRELVDQAIAAADPKWVEQLDLGEQEFGQLLAEILS